MRRKRWIGAQMAALWNALGKGQCCLESHLGTGRAAAPVPSRFTGNPWFDRSRPFLFKSAPSDPRGDGTAWTRSSCQVTMGTARQEASDIVSKYLHDRKEEMVEMHDAFGLEKPRDMDEPRTKKASW